MFQTTAGPLRSQRSRAQSIASVHSSNPSIDGFAANLNQTLTSPTRKLSLGSQKLSGKKVVTRGQSVQPKRSNPKETTDSASSLNQFALKTQVEGELAMQKTTSLKGHGTIVQPISTILPDIPQAQKQTHTPQNLAKFQKMVYNRNFILNIDNDIKTSRVMNEYTKNFYSQLTDSGVLPNALTQHSITTVQQTGGHSLSHSGTSGDEQKIFSASAMKAKLNRMKRINDDSLLQDAQNMLMGSESIPMPTSVRKQSLQQSRDLILPALHNSDSIMSNLNNSIQLTAKAKAMQLFQDSERRQHRKYFTKDLIGVKDTVSQDSDQQEQFKVLGSLEINYESKSDNTSLQQDQQSYIESTVFNIAQDNESEYRDFLKEEGKIMQQERELLANQLPSRLTKDQDKTLDLVRNGTMHSNLSVVFSSQGEIKEAKQPERDFAKLRAKIKLASLKRYEEDEKQRVEDAKAKAAALESSDGMEALKKRKKHAPIKRRLSFTEVQLKFNDINDLYMINKDSEEPSLAEKITIEKMMKAKRYPVREKLMNEPENFWLKIDSIIQAIYNVKEMTENCDNPPDIRATKNSDVSADNATASESSSTEYDEDGNPKKKNVKVVVVEKEGPAVKFEKSLIENQGWRVEPLAVYPHKAREGEVPLRLLKIPKVEYIKRVSEEIAEQQKTTKFTNEEIQSIFDYYCLQFKVSSINIIGFLKEADNARTKLSIRNLNLDEATSKAIACTIPFIVGIYEIEFINNNVSDIMSTVLLISCYMNPGLVRVNYVSNHAKLNFNKTLVALMKGIPGKIKEINTSSSILQVEILDQIMRSFTSFEDLVKVNMSGCSFSVNACRVWSSYIMKTFSLKDLNVSRCKINNQGSRYFIDSINRNSSIRHLNISYNDLGSSIYEFSIKFASILTRHPTLLHADLTQCGFKREETMFIILAMSTSKNFLSLHLTSNDLPYYERVFVRSIIAARVQWAFKNEATTQAIKTNKERNQVMEMASGDNFEPGIKRYLDTFHKLDQERQGLDFEIEDLLKEMNMEKTYANIKEQTSVDQIDENTKLGQLLRKMRARQQEIQKQKEEVQIMMKKTGPSIKQKIDTLAGLKNNDDLNKNAPSGNADQELKNAFENQNEMRLERQRQRAELETVKAQSKKDRSAGELALLFMGINQVAYELLIENPMTGYMNDIIYSRILGTDDLEQGNYWCDTTQCYICQKWEKIDIRFDPRVDSSKWAQKITQIDKLKHTIDTLIYKSEAAEQVHKATQDLSNNVLFEDEKDSKDTYYGLNRSSKGQNMRAVFKKTNYGAADPVKSSLKLSFSQIEGAVDHTVKTPRVLAAVGPDILGPKFGGTGGLSPRITEGQSRKAATFNEDQYRDLSPRSKVMSQVDGGIFSQALDQAEQGAEPALEREDTPKEKVTRPGRQEFNSENPMNPKKLSIQEVQDNIFAKDFKDANDFEELNLQHSAPNTPEGGQREVSHAQHDKYMHQKQMSRFGGSMGGIAPRDFKPKQASLKDLTAQQIKQNEQRYAKPEQGIGAQSVAPSIITTSVSNFGVKRIRGQPQKIQRTLFFQGMVYVIEEEVYSDSDNSSVYSSEDEYEEDKQMAYKFEQRIEVYKLRLEELAEEERLARLRGPVKTEKDLRREKLGIQDDQTKLQLSEAQIAYKTKLWPKHYVPIVKEYKSEQLDLIGKQLELKLTQEQVDEEKTSQRKKNQKDLILSGPLAESNHVYLITSWNDWMPIKMKTKRELVFEKLNPDEPIPKATFVLDNIVKNYSNYVAPGQHYFYFVKQDGTIFLSPKYDVVRFKTTNIFLNRIIQHARKFDFDTVHAVKGGDDQEEVFIKDRSVFRDFRDDTKPFMRKCFEQDIIYSKILRAVKGDVDIFEDIQLVLYKHFVKLNNIFLFYCGTSSYPTIGMNDFTSWARHCDMVDDKWLNLAALDRILITTNVALHGLISSAERDLNRYEFLEIIVRLATALYKESKVCDSIPAAILKLLNENIYPNSKEVSGEHFRRFHCYNVKVNEILKKNEGVLKRVYDLYTHNKKKFVRLDEMRDLIRRADINVSDMQCGPIYAESMCTIQDTIIDQTRPQQMKFVEFLVFICKISYQHYRGTPYENEMMHLMIEHTLPKYCNVANAVPQFLFNEPFEYKPTVKKVKQKKVIVVKKKESSGSEQDSETPKEEENEEDDETSSEDDLGEVIVLEDGKFKLSQIYMESLDVKKAEKAERRKVREETKQKKLEEKAAKEAERRKRLEEQQKNKKKFAKLSNSAKDLDLDEEEELDQE